MTATKSGLVAKRIELFAATRNGSESPLPAEWFHEAAQAVQTQFPLTAEEIGKADKALPICQATHTGRWGWERIGGCIDMNACNFHSRLAAENNRNALIASHGSLELFLNS